MSSLISYNDFILAIQTIAQNKPLSTQLHMLVQNMLSNGNMVPELNRKSFNVVTKRFLETGSYSLNGNITYTGTQTYTGTVTIPDSVTTTDLNNLRTEISNQFYQVNGAVSTSVVSDTVDYSISGSTLGSVKSAISVPFSSNYILNLTGSSSFLPGTVCKFMIINNPDTDLVALTGFAYQFSIDSDTPTTFTASSTHDINVTGCTALQEITVINISGTINVYSNIIFMAP